MGSFSDPAELPGLAHFLEHMLFYASAKFPEEVRLMHVSVRSARSLMYGLFTWLRSDPVYNHVAEISTI